MRVNDELAKALRLSDDEIQKINNSSNDKDPNGLNFYNAQKWIKRAYEKESNANNQIKSDIKEEVTEFKKTKEVKSNKLSNEIVKNEIVKNKIVKKEILQNEIVLKEIQVKNNSTNILGKNDDIIVVPIKKSKSKGI
jgi:hypothetical protein